MKPKPKLEILLIVEKIDAFFHTIQWFRHSTAGEYP